MTTLIMATKSDGSITGRCDARCYLAKHSACKCICGGMNHGKGFDSAVLNNSLKQQIRRTADTAVYVLFPYVQYSLFTGGKS